MAITTPPKLEPIELPPEPGLLRGWGKKFETTLVRFALTLYNAMMGPFWAGRDLTLKHLFQTIEDELKPVLLPFLDSVDSIENLPPEIRAMTKHLRFSEPLTFAAIGSALIVAAIMGLAMGLVGPFQRLASQKTDTLARSARLDPPAAFAAWKRGAIGKELFEKCCKEHGWHDDIIAAFSEIFAQRMGVGDLSTLRLRDVITQEQWSEELMRRGYEPVEIGKLSQLLQVIPPLPDIIRMSVREAFTPAVIHQFQLRAELPDDMVAWAKKQGLSETWAEAYWVAHWELPSLTMGFEMLHRGEISESDMELLIKTHDVSPFWRDKLLAISYSPYTRVDVRRMYEAGVLGVEDVLRSYMDIGYDREKATKMTEFTVALSNAAERDLTKAEVLNGFKIGYFGQEEVKEQLLALGYDKTEAAYYVSKVLYDLWQTEIKDQVKYLEMQYVKGLIDQNTVYSELGRLNLPAEQVNRYIRTWDVKREAKTKTLTATQLATFRKQAVIGDDQFRTEMSGIGYNSQYVEWWLQSIKMGG